MINFKKKKESQKKKVFEDYFMELQSDMVSICLEYVENNAGNGITYDVSPERQRDFLHIMADDMMKLIKLCNENNRPMPTEMKMIYDVNTKKFDVDYSYELMYTNHKTKTVDTVSNAWYEEVKNNEVTN